MAYTTIDDPTAYFQTTLYNGNNGTQTITHTGHSDLQADWIWGKARNDTAQHFLIDSVRGVSKRLKSNNADAEATVSTGITAIGSNSFSLGNDGDFNDGVVNYASWNWKAGTSFTNDASATGIGTIDSTGSASTAAGFSIVSYTGTGSAGTIKHGLSSIPKMIIMKTRSTSNIWSVYHVGLGNTKYMQLNEPDPSTDNDTYWSDTTPTSSVFSVGTASGVNGNGTTNIAYCFADVQGYSKMGSYTGNGSGPNGPFIYLGFKPAFVMFKRANSTGAWSMQDNKRTPFNEGNKALFANTNAAESTSDNSMDFVSNGFRVRTDTSNYNTSGGTYIFMAFAENPFTTSSGVPACAR